MIHEVIRISVTCISERSVRKKNKDILIYYVYLARLHFSAEELLLYRRRPFRRQRLRRHPHAKC